MRCVLQLPPWGNLWLLGSIALSMALHAFILYVPPAAAMFSVTPLNASEWLAVLWLSFPVILVDEVLKYITRCSLTPQPVAPPLHVQTDWLPQIPDVKYDFTLLQRGDTRHFGYGRRQQ